MTADFCQVVDDAANALSGLIFGDGDDGPPVGHLQARLARDLVTIERLTTSLDGQAALIVAGGHQAALVVQGHAPAIAEDLKLMISSLPRVVAVLASGPKRAPLSLADAAYTLDLSTFTCSCPSCSLPVLSGRLCKQILAAAHGRALTADRFNGLVAEVAAEYRDLWHANQRGVLTLSVCGHVLTSFGGGVFSCACNYMACALGRLCLFPFCPALTFVMINRGGVHADAARQCLRFSGTEVGSIIDRFWMEKVSGDVAKLTIIPMQRVQQYGEVEKFVKVRDARGRKHN
jgi:hypothetical protein